MAEDITKDLVKAISRDATTPEKLDTIDAGQRKAYDFAAKASGKLIETKVKQAQEKALAAVPEGKRDEFNKDLKAYAEYRLGMSLTKLELADKDNKDDKTAKAKQLKDIQALAEKMEKDKPEVKKAYDAIKGAASPPAKEKGMSPTAGELSRPQFTIAQTLPTERGM